MSEEEKKAIEYTKLDIKITKEQLENGDLFMLEKQERERINNLKIILNLIEKQQEQLQEKDKVIDLIASEIVEFTGSCPLDAYDYEGIDCENKCDTGIEKQCFIEYFTKKAREV